MGHDKTPRIMTNLYTGYWLMGLGTTCSPVFCSLYSVRSSMHTQSFLPFVLCILYTEYGVRRACSLIWRCCSFPTGRRGRKGKRKQTYNTTRLRSTFRKIRRLCCCHPVFQCDVRKQSKARPSCSVALSSSSLSSIPFPVLLRTCRRPFVPSFIALPFLSTFPLPSPIAADHPQSIPTERQYQNNRKQKGLRTPPASVSLAKRMCDNTTYTPPRCCILSQIPFPSLSNFIVNLITTDAAHTYTPHSSFVHIALLAAY